MRRRLQGALSQDLQKKRPKHICTPQTTLYSGYLDILEIARQNGEGREKEQMKLRYLDTNYSSFQYPLSFVFHRERVSWRLVIQPEWGL